MEIIAELKKLELAPTEFVVIGSGIMAAKGLKESKDIDLLVSPRAFEELRQRGWKCRMIDFEGGQYEHLEEGLFEALTAWIDDKELDYYVGNPGRHEVVDGFNFLSLQELLVAKRRLGRPKDMTDIAVVEGFLAQGGAS